MKKYDLGIIGGMGSEATVELYKRIIENTIHHTDQENMKICILNNSIIPDRTNYIINNGENPLPYLLESINDLEKIGVNYFIIPCNTAHYFENEFKKQKIQFISMIEETLKFIKKEYSNKKVCILATLGTINSKVYFNHKEAKGIDFIYLTPDEQKEVMQVITDVKADLDKEKIANNFLKVIKQVFDREKDCLFVLACTELSLFKNIVSLNYQVVDAMDCLVKESITRCGYKLK